MTTDLSVPIWTIEHVAAALHLEVDTAREYTYREDFPAAKAGFARNLWLREEILAWFTNLPTAPRRAAKSTRRANTGTRASTAVKANPAPTADTAAASPARKLKPYQPRSQ